MSSLKPKMPPRPRLRKRLSTRNLSVGAAAVAVSASGLGVFAGEAIASLGHRHVYFSSNCTPRGYAHHGPQHLVHGSESNYGGTNRGGGCNGSGYVHVSALFSPNGGLAGNTQFGAARSKSPARSNDVTNGTYLPNTDASKHSLQGVSHYNY